MVKIIPFRAFHYDFDSNIESLVAPPYDVISNVELFKQNPYNITHLELPTNYKTAADKLNDWISQKILKMTSNESFYIYRIKFIFQGEEITRLALISLLELSDFSERKVLPHEMTFPKCMDDRLNLIRATKANFSPVFMIYRGTNKIREILLKETKNTPLFQIKDEKKFTHEIWKVDDRHTINEITHHFNDISSVIIADGHHRYKTALNYYKETGKNGYVMTYLVDTNDPGLKVYPTHRLIKNSSSITVSQIHEKLQDLFEMRETSEEHELFIQLKKNKDRHAFGFYSREGKFLLLVLKQDINPINLISLKKSDSWKRLDVSILHEIIIKEKLGINGKVEFSKDPKQAIKLVISGDYDATFILNPTRISEIELITEKGELMPHKSTYFYPKPLSGVLIWVHDR
ncbi:MAG: DUF1015 domain-containing protein [Candidatus Helarchaeota archaeon]